MAGDELKNDLATILDVRSENLVETMTILLCKLNDTGVSMDESLTVESETAAAEAAAAASAEASAAVSAAAAASAAASLASAAVSAADVLEAAAVTVAEISAAAAATVASLVTAAEVSAEAAVTAAELLQPPPVVYSAFTRPLPFEMIELNEDAFKVGGKYGKIRSDAAAKMGKYRAVNEFVNLILGDYFSVKYTPQQLVLALRESSKHPDVRMLFKSAGLTDVEDLDALKFHNEQIHRILQTTNDTKKKGSATDDVRSYEQCLYSAMAESPPSSNCTRKVPTVSSRARLFPKIPKTTVKGGMNRGKRHRKNMRENTTAAFSRVLKRLGRTKVSAELEEAFLKW